MKDSKKCICWSFLVCIDLYNVFIIPHQKRKDIGLVFIHQAFSPSVFLSWAITR